MQNKTLLFIHFFQLYHLKWELHSDILKEKEFIFLQLSVKIKKKKGGKNHYREKAGIITFPVLPILPLFPLCVLLLLLPTFFT